MAQSGYTPVQLYRSTTAGAVPSASNLADGELAINIADGALFYKNTSGTVTALTGSGTGYVTLTGVQTLTNKTLVDPSITGTIREDVYALTDAATVNVDPGNGSIQTLTLSGTGRTLTFTNMLDGEAVTLMINDGTSGTITTWNVTWVNNAGAAPTLSTTGYSVVSVWKVGGTVYAALVGNA